MGNRGTVVIKEDEKVSGIRIYTQHGANRLTKDVQNFLKEKIGKNVKYDVEIYVDPQLAALFFDYLRKKEDESKWGSAESISLWSGDMDLGEWLIITLVCKTQTVIISVDGKVVLQESFKEFIKDTEHLKHIK